MLSKTKSLTPPPKDQTVFINDPLSVNISLKYRNINYFSFPLWLPFPFWFSSKTCSASSIFFFRSWVNFWIFSLGRPDLDWRNLTESLRRRTIESLLHWAVKCHIDYLQWVIPLQQDVQLNLRGGPNVFRISDGQNRHVLTIQRVFLLNKQAAKSTRFWTLPAKLAASAGHICS